MSENNKIMLMDGLSLINRAFYALPLLTTKDGLPTNAIIGFLNIFFKQIEDESPAYVAVAFDLPQPTFRHLRSVEYKATRKPFPDDLSAQIPLLKDVLRAMNVPIVEAAGYEADDIMGTLACRAEKQGLAPTIVTGDRDLLQIATDAIRVRIPRTSRGQTTVEDYYAADFIEKMGVTPTQYIDVKGLMGDASDNIPGVPTIGEKTAIRIIQAFGDIETAIAAVMANPDAVSPKRAAQNLLEYADLARLSKELATIVTDADIPQTMEDLRLGEVINPASIGEFRRLELKSLLKKFGGEIAAKSPEITAHTAISGRILHNPAEISSFLAELPTNRPVAYHIVYEGGTAAGLAIAAADNIVYISLQHIEFSQVAPFFEGDYPKVAFDAKKDLHLLRRHGCEMKNLVFDLLLAGYLLGNVNDGDSISDISLEYLKQAISTPVVQEQLSLFEAVETPAASADLAFAQVDVVAQVHPLMAQMLENQQLDRVFYEIEMPLLFVLADMEEAGIAIDANFLTEYGKTFGEKIDALTKEIHALGGSEFNINSTKQLAKVLFEDLGIKSLKKTKTGHSTNVEVLEKLAPQHEIAAKILEYRSYTKLRSTYVDGLLAAIADDGRVHTTFNQAVSATGRLSSVEPNLQNIPVRTALGRELRRAFVARAGCVFVDADYSQIELRVLAELSQDPTMLAAFAEGQDIHGITAAQVFGVAFDEVDADKRRIAKAVNFGIVYGISAYGLAEDIKVSVREAESFISGYFDKYPLVKQYLDSTVESARQAGYASTIFGRRRRIPELFHQAHNTRSYGERIAMNMPVQGTAADIIKIAMVRVFRRLRAEGQEARLILQVHDELLIETPVDEVDMVREIMIDEMQNAVKLTIPLSIDVETGKSWYDAK